MLHAPVVGPHVRPPATRTVRPPEPHRTLHPFSSATVKSRGAVAGRMVGVVLQRKCECGGGPDCDCDTGTKKHHGELHRAATGAWRVPQAPPIVHDVLRSPGQPLDSDTLAFFESRFGRDLSAVRVHTDSHAAESARAVHALGYTVGEHIAFAAGQYQPGSESGRRLLAHELAHTAQQQGAARDSESLAVAPATGPDEQIADRMAAHALFGSLTEMAADPAQPASAGGSPASVARSFAGPLLQRQAQVTCSVDFAKIARAKAGDKIAAAEILNCCQSGLTPLPAGCTADLIDLLNKLSGKKPEDKTTCPPGFHRGKTEKYKGQCCKDSAAGESVQDCCPPERLSPLFGTCCPPGQIAQGTKCVPAGGLPPR